MPASASAAPILVVVFNRPDKTRALVDQFLAFEGLNILVAADGPRTEAERAKTDDVRAIIGELADRHHVQTRFADRNLGCGTNVAAGIHWAFERHERLIIIEDDIRISREFLDFCNHGLEAHRDRDDVLCLSSGPLVNLDPTAFPATFLTRYPNIWGWATWRDRFAGYSITLEGHTVGSLWRVLTRTFPDRPMVRVYFLLLLLLVRSGRIDTWDFQYYFMGWEKRALTLMPTRNLAQNVGFDIEATHTRRAPDNVAQMRDSVADPVSLAEMPAVPSEEYDRLIERDLYRIDLLQIARFIVKYLVARPKRYRLSAASETG